MELVFIFLLLIAVVSIPLLVVFCMAFIAQTAAEAASNEVLPPDARNAFPVELIGHASSVPLATLAMPVAPPFIPADLSPGDTRAVDADVSGLTFRVVRSPSDMAFDVGYRALWNEFGEAHEVETRDVLERRLTWHPANPVDGVSLLYEMIVVTQNTDISVAGVRDHTAIVGLERALPCVLVHLSHNWVAPEFRGKGLAGWMRAFPVDTARRACRVAGLPASTLITLVAEMEHPEAGLPDRIPRLRAYEKAGFMCVDPEQVPYHQPDFREPSIIDATGGARPLPFRLILRRVGREQETHVSGAELQEIVEMLYTMYATSFRAQDVAVVRATLARYPSGDARIKLVKPTLGATEAG